MEQLTRYGMELATLIRREKQAEDELLGTRRRIDELIKIIREEEPGTLYGQGTIRPDDWTEDVTKVIDPVIAEAASVSYKIDNHEDRTFNLTPLATEALTATRMAAIVDCDASCSVEYPHFHTRDGRTHRREDSPESS